MLTVDYERLGLRRGERLLDLGAGAGRHAFEALRRGAHVVALDVDDVELKHAASVMDAMFDSGDVPQGASGTAVNGSALDLPFPDASFDRVIAAEVMEHVGDDSRALRELVRVLRPGGTIGVTVPRWFPELVCWALTDEYHAPFVAGGHVRIYRESALANRMRDAGLEVIDRHHSHGLHTPYWWLKCAVGVRNDEHAWVKRYHDVLVREMSGESLALRVVERALQPVIGKSLVLYGRKTAQ